MTLLVIMLLLHIPKFVAWAFPVLISYALFFFAMPAARALWVLVWCARAPFPNLRSLQLQVALSARSTIPIQSHELTATEATQSLTSPPPSMK